MTKLSYLKYKTSEVRAKCNGLMRVNLYKDQIKTAGSMPPLPNDKALYASLRPAYHVLKAAGKDRARGRPMYAISEEQKRAADSLLKVRQESKAFFESHGNGFMDTKRAFKENSSSLPLFLQ